MSGIVGGFNNIASGLIINSVSDGTVCTGTGAGLPVAFEAAAGAGRLLKMAYVNSSTTANPWTNFGGWADTPYAITYTPEDTTGASQMSVTFSLSYQKNNTTAAAYFAFLVHCSLDGGYVLGETSDAAPYPTSLSWSSGWHYYNLSWTLIDINNASSGSGGARTYTIQGRTTPVSGSVNWALGLDSAGCEMIVMEYDVSGL